MFISLFIGIGIVIGIERLNFDPDPDPDPDPDLKYALRGFETPDALTGVFFIYP